MKQWKLLIPPLLSLLLILGTSTLVILYGRGFRPGIPTNGDNNIVRSTGLLSTTSDPVGSQVYVDGLLKTATNNSFNIDPGVHTVRILKEGYLPWQKEIKVDKEVVSRADAFLFPTNPSLSPLTSSGILQPTLSPDGTKIAYIVPPSESTKDTPKATGLWVYDLADRPLGFNRDQRQLGVWQQNWENANLTIQWSPTSQQILIERENSSDARLYEVSRTGETTLSSQGVTQLKIEWHEEDTLRKTQQLVAFKQPFIDIATSSSRLLSFSPDETKVLYEATASATLPFIIVPPLIGSNSTPENRSIEPGNIYVYDKKEDKNYFLFSTKELLPSPTPTPTGVRRPSPTPTAKLIPVGTSFKDYPIRWFPTNNHLVITLHGKIDILEYDRTNWVTVYAGPFAETFIAPWPGGSRLIIVTNLNPGASPLPNLYTVNLR